MAKFEFKKDTKKEAKKPRPVKKTEISKPQETYDPMKTTQKVEKDLETKVEKRRVDITNWLSAYLSIIASS